VKYVECFLPVDRAPQPVFLVISGSQAKNQAGLQRPVTACAHHLVFPSANAWGNYDLVLAGNDRAGLLIWHYRLFGRKRAGNGNGPELRAFELAALFEEVWNELAHILDEPRGQVVYVKLPNAHDERCGHVSDCLPFADTEDQTLQSHLFKLLSCFHRVESAPGRDGVRSFGNHGEQLSQYRLLGSKKPAKDSNLNACRCPGIPFRK